MGRGEGSGHPRDLSLAPKARLPHLGDMSAPANLPALRAPDRKAELADLAIRYRRANGPVMALVNRLGGSLEGRFAALPDGLRHQVEAAVERALGANTAPRTAGRRLWRWFVTFHIVVFAFVLFRAHDMAGFWAMLAGLVQFDGPNESVTWRLLALTLLGLSFHFWPADLRERIELRLRRWPALALGALCGVVLLLILLAGPEGVAPFIYFQF